MPLESINQKQSESIASKAKGFAQQVLNLVNQALFDSLESSSDFSEVLKAESAKIPSQSDIPTKDSSKKANFQEETEVSMQAKSTKSPEIVKEISENSKKLDSVEKSKTAELAESKKDQTVESEVITAEITGEIATEASETVEQQLPADQVATDSMQLDAVQSEAIAATVIAQTQIIKTDKKEISAEKAEVYQLVDEVAAETSAEVVIPAVSTPLATAEEVKAEGANIKEAKPQHLKEAFQRAAEAVENASSQAKTTIAEQEKNTVTDNIIVFKDKNPDKLNLEANLQQFVAKKALSDSVLASAILVERLQNINADHINPAKTANTSIKINTAETAISIGQKSTALIVGSAANIGLNNQNAQDSGQKLDASKHSKALNKGLSISVLEKIEVIMKKIADSKDGSTISLRLDPPQLGSVRADVSLKDGVLHARLTADNPQVQQLLRERASDLQVTLRKMGLEVEKVSISVTSEDYGTFTGDAEERQGRNETRQGSFFSAPAEIAELSDSNILDHWIA